MFCWAQKTHQMAQPEGPFHTISFCSKVGCPKIPWFIICLFPWFIMFIPMVYHVYHVYHRLSIIEPWKTNDAASQGSWVICSPESPVRVARRRDFDTHGESLGELGLPKPWGRHQTVTVWGQWPGTMAMQTIDDSKIDMINDGTLWLKYHEGGFYQNKIIILYDDWFTWSIML